MFASEYEFDLSILDVDQNTAFLYNVESFDHSVVDAKSENNIINSTNEMFQNFEESEDFFQKYFSEFLHNQQKSMDTISSLADFQIEEIFPTSSDVQQEIDLNIQLEQTTGISEFLKEENYQPSIDQEIRLQTNQFKVEIPGVKRISKKHKMETQEKGKPRVFSEQSRIDKNIRSLPTRCQSPTCKQHYNSEEVARNQAFVSALGNGTKCALCQKNAQYFAGYNENGKIMWRSRAWFCESKKK
jgi:hypothetical protein